MIEEKKIGNSYYIIDNKMKTAEFAGVDSQNQYSVTVPSSIKYYNKEYTVIGISPCDCILERFLSITELILPDTIEKLRRSHFSHFPYLKTIKLGNGITEIPSRCFYDCKNLKNITFGNKLKKIGEAAFQDCTRLCHLDLPNSLEEINPFAFLNSGVVKVRIPENVRIIRTQAFNRCPQVFNDLRFLGPCPRGSITESIFTKTNKEKKSKGR